MGKSLNLDEVKKRCQDHYIELNTLTYVDTKHKCQVKCLKCGYVWNVKLNDIFNGHGCPNCYIKSHTRSTYQAKEDLYKVYNKNEFDFSNIEYNGSHVPITAVCNKCGMKITTNFNRFISHKVNCVCNDNYKKSKLEIKCKQLLTNNNIEHICHDKSILGGLELDFYIPSKNIGIECQGIQHFVPKSFGSKNKEKVLENFKKQIERDKRKSDLCKEKGIKLIYFLEEGHNKYIKNDVDLCFNNEKDIIEYINKI